VTLPALRLLFRVTLLLALPFALACCTPSGPEWVDEGQRYSIQQTRALLGKVEPGGLAKTPVTDAKELRHDRLVGLRSNGGNASKAADLITKTFPVDTAAVPLYVERAVVDDAPALVLIEAWGPTGGDLDLERVWVIDEADGRIIDAASVN
jgi:hypothetical protein